ncbi:MAG: 3-hydroxyacyl-ACP dehydratase FabZ [Oscillospiraceae bacterium]|jgi:3-hydroxyacyl-[acyl-carrier-protein] dehydratase|nr:3-hydroxyacyl-ACP dehydratase FabZ [Oscillospiraceae bacterium]
MVIYDKEQIKKIIPHRDPFLLIDEVNELEIGIKAVATKYIKADDFWFKGHFPDYPVTPGVLMVEMLAQTGAVAILAKEENKGKLAFFAGIDNVKFKRQVVPGDILVLTTEITKTRGAIGIGTGTATVNGELAVSGEIKFAIK